MKSYFVSSVSHDLKTPLTSIKIFSELLRDRDQIDEVKRREYLSVIEGESDRLRRLIDNVLDYSKIEKGIQTYDKKQIKVADVIDTTLKAVEYQFKMAKIRLESEICDADIEIIADPDAVEEAVINLLSNAIKYSEKNTTVKLTLFRKNSIP